MKTHTLLAVILVVLIVPAIGLQAVEPTGEHYFKVESLPPAEWGKLPKSISVDHLEGTTIYAYAVGMGWEDLLRSGIAFTELPHPGSLYKATMWNEKDGGYDFTTYPSFDQYVTLMEAFPSKYPNAAGLSELHIVGTSVLGRDLLAIRISGNLAAEEGEPEILFTSSIHGDETAGFVLSLRLIDSLLAGYGTDSLITRLIDSTEIWICPLINPDGTYRHDNAVINSPARFNESGVDLNRNYPDLLFGDTGHIRQPETQAMIDLAAAHSFTLAANFHAGREFIVFPWMTTDEPLVSDWNPRFSHPDSIWFDRVARAYVDSVRPDAPAGYMDDSYDGILQGNWFYPATGTASDYRVFRHGCREITAEISMDKFLPESELAAHWSYNRTSIFNFMEEALYGIRGRVTSAVGGEPLTAIVKVVGHDTDRDSSRIFTDPDVGDYHRYIQPGTYTLKFLAPGFVPEVITDVVITGAATAWFDTSMRICGDANGDLSVNLGDAVYLQNYLFRGGPPPADPESGDADCDGSLTIADVMYLVNYVFSGGSAPCAGCE